MPPLFYSPPNGQSGGGAAAAGRGRHLYGVGEPRGHVAPNGGEVKVSVIASSSLIRLSAQSAPGLFLHCRGGKTRARVQAERPPPA